MAELGFDFFLVGDPWDKPEELTKLLKIEPTYIKYFGEAIGEINRKESPYTIWMYSSPYIIEHNLDKLTEMLLERFENKVQIIKEYASKYPSVEVKLWFVIRTDQENFPALYLNQKLISFLSKVNASIDFDIYIDDIYKFNQM